MPLNPAVPTIVGQPQTARKNVHAVAMPNPLEDLGRSLGNLGRGALSLGLGIADIQHERDMADYRRTLNDAIAEANQRMNDEVFSQEGFSAEGSLERAGNIFQEVWDKYGGKVRGERNKQRLEEEFGAFRNNQMNRTMGFERSNLTSAQIGANNQLIKSGVNAYVESLDPNMMAVASQAHDDNWRIRNGGHLVNNATVEAFKRDIEDEDGRITLRDGRKLDIVEEAEPGTPGVITKKQAESMLKNMEKQAEAYEASRMNMWDMAHAQVIDRYLDDDRVSDADAYLKDVDNRGLISKDAKHAATEAIGRKREAVEVSTETTKLIDQIQAKAGGDSIAYGSPEQDRIYTELRREISKKYTGEKAKLGQQILQQLDMKYRLLEDAQKARAASDTVAVMITMQKSGFDLPAQAKYIAGMKDSPVKAALEKAHARQVAAYKAEREEFNGNTDPMFLVEQENALNLLKMSLANGHGKLDGIEYNLSDQEQLKAFALNLGLTDANRKRAAKYITASQDGVDALQAATELAKQLGDGTSPMEALERYPFVLSDLETIKGTAVIEQDKMAAWLKTNIAAILEQDATNHNRVMPEKAGTLSGLLDDGVDPDEIYQTTEQVKNTMRQREAQTLLQRGDMEGAAAALKKNYTDAEAAEYMRKQGRKATGKGRYYYTTGSGK